MSDWVSATNETGGGTDAHVTDAHVTDAHPSPKRALASQQPYLLRSLLC